MSNKKENDKKSKDEEVKDVEVEKKEEQPTKQIKYLLGEKQMLDVFSNDFLFTVWVPKGISEMNLYEFGGHVQLIAKDLMERAQQK